MSRPRLAQVVATGSFAGVERYVCNISNLLSAGWDVTVVGGQGAAMRKHLDPGISWLAGSNTLGCMVALLRAGHVDLVHAHMTAAELCASITTIRSRGPVVSTRHFAARRGKTWPGRVIAPWVEGRLTTEIAMSQFVASGVGRTRELFLVPPAVPDDVSRWSADSKVVLVLQRLDKEKDTHVALLAWETSRLWDMGWTMRIVGSGPESSSLSKMVSTRRIPDVTLTGWSGEVSRELDRAGLMLAPAPAEPLGLSVLEAMAAGIPVVASSGGGHAETVARAVGARMFQPGDHLCAARLLRELATSDSERAELSSVSRTLQRREFGMLDHVRRIEGLYRDALSTVSVRT